MAAVTITSGCVRRARPTTRPRVPVVAAGRACRASPVTYWRRRVAAALVGLGLVFVTAQAGAALGGSSLGAPERRPAVSRIVVRPGDSLWTIARRLGPGDDPRPVVDGLEQSRHGAPLVPGETITWPR